MPSTDSPAESVLAMVEMCYIVASHSGFVGAWRLAGVCRGARAGAKGWLRTLSRLVVCGGQNLEDMLYPSEVWRLDLWELRWERMPDLVTGRVGHACCAARGAVVVLGGGNPFGADIKDNTLIASVETLQYDTDVENIVCKVLPPLGSVRPRLRPRRACGRRER
jgi:hypothetical protein